MALIHIILIIAFLPSMACETVRGPTSEDVRIRNRENLNRLTVGMTRGSVLNVMGTETVQTYIHRGLVPTPYQKVPHPYRTESLRASDGTQVEILYYYTDLARQDHVISKDELTPLILEEGRLVGWGWSYLNQNVDRYEIEIRTR